MPAWLLYLLKGFTSELLMYIAKWLMSELEQRDDNTIVKDAKKIIDILDNNEITQDVTPEQKTDKDVNF